MKLAALMPLVRRAAPAGLLGADRLAWLETLAAKLPYLAGGGFEIPLAGRTEGWALALRATPGASGSLAKLATADAHFPVSPATRPAWDRVATLARALDTADTPESRAVSDLWLELDVTPGSDAIGAPNLFAGVARPIGAHATGGPNAATHRAAAVAALESTLAPFVEPNADRSALIANFVAVRRPSTRLTFIGAMLGRAASTPAAVRMTLARVDVREVIPKLRRIGWTHDTQALKPLIQLVRQHARHVVLHVDLGATVGDAVGLEVSFHGAGDRNPDAAWERFLHHLARFGVASFDEVTALRAWRGTDSRQTADAALWTGIDPGFRAFHRDINHVKLTYRPAGTSVVADPGPPRQVRPGHPPIRQRRTVAPMVAAGRLSAKAYLSADLSERLAHPKHW